MGVIRKLPQDLVNQIAAGEVVERPASAVKELCENAIDAGARRIEVQLEDGGRRLIRVVDDGRGIAAEDLPLAVASHATSKIASLDDLFRVGTLGFRGEALASIGSVAELRVASRPEGADGAEVLVSGGACGEVRPAGVARGTTIEVRSLFYNTPARRKFLKEGPGELRACVDLLTRLALASPAVGFRCAHEGRVVLEAPPVPPGTSPEETLRSRVADLFGREVAEDLVPVASAGGGVRVGGLAALPRRTRGDGTHQFIMLNGRAIRDRLVVGAIAQGYHGFLMTRRFPVVFMTLAADVEAVDVNVHPAKLEVRFREPREVFPAVARAIRNALEAVRVDPVLEPVAAATALARVATSPSAAPRIAEPGPPYESGPRLKGFEPLDIFARPVEAKTPEPLSVGVGLRPTPTSTAPASERGGPEGPRHWRQEPSPRSPSPAPPAREPALAPPHLQLATGYLVVEKPDGFEVIDPHALHERILYEQFKERVAAGAVEVQGLLVPEVVELTPLEEARLASGREMLAEVGLVVEPFGPRAAAVQAVPAILSRRPAWGGIVKDLLGAVEDDAQGEGARMKVLDLLVATMACKAAVKLGERLKPGEVEALLARRALADRSHLCPHGRPTALAFPVSAIERQFQR